jgi:hypothetical protein
MHSLTDEQFDAAIDEIVRLVGEGCRSGYEPVYDTHTRLMEDRPHWGMTAAYQDGLD